MMQHIKRQRQHGRPQRSKHRLARGIRERNHFARRDPREAALMLSRTMREPGHARPMGAGSSSSCDPHQQRQPGRQSCQPHHLYPASNFVEPMQMSTTRQDALAGGLAQIIPSRPSLDNTPTTSNAMQLIKSKSKIHKWHWNDSDVSNEVIISDDKLEVYFHPECAENTVAIRGSQPFRRNGNYYYWEVTIHDKIFGTSMMLGLCTEEQALHRSGYCNLIGFDKNGWSLSHKGLIWHNGKYSKYTNDFSTNQTLTVGLLLDTLRGELSYFLNGQNLGVAFSGLNNCNSDLYPVIGSTAKRTRMRLSGIYCGDVSLFKRTCYIILKNIRDSAVLARTLQENRVPRNLIDHMAELAELCSSQSEKTAKSVQCAGV